LAKQARSAQLRTTPSSPSSNEPDAGRELALQVAEAALDKKAARIEIIDVRGKVDYTDYVVVMSGRSDRQVAAIARGIEEDLKHKHGARCSGVEGLPQGNWVLLDFGDVVTHIFHQDTRGYYDLEALWLDADRVEFEGQTAEEGFVFP
jgi:ribosome-associated protein